MDCTTPELVGFYLGQRARLDPSCELVHIKDHLNEHIDILANKRHLHESEREAYAWMISNARHFKLSLELKREILRLSEKYNR